MRAYHEAGTARARILRPGRFDGIEESGSDPHVDDDATRRHRNASLPSQHSWSGCAARISSNIRHPDAGTSLIGEEFVPPVDGPNGTSPGACGIAHQIPHGGADPSGCSVAEAAYPPTSGVLASIRAKPAATDSQRAARGAAEAGLMRVAPARAR